MMKRIIGLLFLSCSFLPTSIVLAESAYIVDQLLVGLHQEKDIDSPIIKVLSTGTEVDIIIREGDFAQIRENTEGKIGWVDASYLMLDKPAKLQLQILQEKIKTLENMKSVQASQEIQDQNEEKTEELNKQVEDLKQNLSSEKIKAGELEAKISQQEKKLAKMEASVSDNNDKRTTELEKENGELKEKLISLKNEKAEQSSTKVPAELSYLQIFNSANNKLMLIVLGVMMLIAFMFGRRWEDKNNRKRHGGFRV